MKENLKALEKTTSQAGKDIQPEHEEDAKTVQKGYFEDSQVKDRSLENYAGDWNQFIHTCKMELWIRSLIIRQN